MEFVNPSFIAFSAATVAGSHSEAVGAKPTAAATSVAQSSPPFRAESNDAKDGEVENVEGRPTAAPRYRDNTGGPLDRSKHLSRCPGSEALARKLKK